jgi:hemolysin III
MTTYNQIPTRATVRPVQLRSEPKPLLRGWSHALAALASVVFTAAMLARASDTPRMAGAAVFGVSMILLYSVSAVYHRYHWDGRSYQLLTAVDHANIFVMIAGTFTPFGLAVLSGRYGATMLVLIWALAAVGMCCSGFALHLPRWAMVAQYIGLGWTAGSAMPQIGAALPPEALALLITGGVVYSVGGVIYALRRPDPIPHIFGFHEIFHLMVVAGNVLTALVVWRWVL